MADVGVPAALSAEFPQADHGDWLELAGDVARLRTTTYDGVTIEPLYTAGDPIADAGLPGFQPFVRGRTAAGTRDGWDIRQLVDVSRGQGPAVAGLERGATSIWLRFGRDGAFDQPSLERVLDGVYFDMAPIVLDAGSQWLAAARGLRVLWERQGVDRSVVGGSFGADPFGDWADHRDATLLDADLRALSDEAGALSTEHPTMRVATIDGTRFHDAGASDAQELGVVLAGVVATLRTLTAGGLDVASAFGQLEVRLAATVEQFATIAKFRAARRLLARVAEVAGEPTAAGCVPLHAVTSRPMVTRYDRAVNIVRATIACFAAAVGGADAVTVLPHDSVVRRSASELAIRLARNTHAVLAMESNIARVVDPAGGSWYVERFTAALAQRAWDVFQEIEAAGGFRAAVEAGIVADRIATTRSTRGADVDHRRAPIVGVSAFPSLDDVVPTTDEPGPEPTYRWAAGFEALRARVDAAAGAGRRPTVFLARCGSSAATAQAITTAANFFGIAGLDTPRGPATDDVDDIVEAFAPSGTSIACICAAAGLGDTRRDELRAALEAAGATRVYSAIDLGGDARAELSDLLDHLEVA